MAILLDPLPDGLRLSIDGDLQFDSRDERIYHESLILPGLALAARRVAGPLRALICGGGDGLCARELLKEPRVAAVDLVDYSDAVLALARDELADLNARSLHDPRVTVHVRDVWDFLRTDAAAQSYDLIICDLTVPQDVAGAALHSPDWYRLLAGRLAASGVLAINAVSPTASPEAYWAIAANLRAAGLAALPYRVALPSFTAQGYGPDWGFVLAAPAPIQAAELADDLPLAGPRHELHSPAHLRRLFQFPAAVAERRAVGPATPGVLLHYIRNGQGAGDAADCSWDALAHLADPWPAPGATAADGLLPADLRRELAGPARPAVDEAALLHRLLKLMPALDRAQTRDMLAAFLTAPARFLAAVDLPRLVARLLERAAELPRRLVRELRFLRQRLARREAHAEPEGLLHLGLRIVTIIVLVVMLAHIAMPDMVYGKGSSDGGAATAAHPMAYGAGNSSTYAPDAPIYATGGGYRSPTLGTQYSVDESGTLFPTRTYHFYSTSYYSRRYNGRRYYEDYDYGASPGEAASESVSSYRLTAETDVLPDGQVVISVTNGSYLLIGPDATTLTDAQTGAPLLFLASDPALRKRVANELDRQSRGLAQSAAAKQRWLTWIDWLEFSPWYGDDQRELANLQETTTRLAAALKNLGDVSDAPVISPPPMPGAIEVFSSVWMMPDGSALILEMADGSRAYMTGTQWYSDPELLTPRSTPYPAGARAVIVSDLQERVRNSAATLAALNMELSDLNTDNTQLQSDLSEYQGLMTSGTGLSENVDYGTEQITLSDALARTQNDLAVTKGRIEAVQAQIAGQPESDAAARRMITTLGGSP
jgi:spermidine synthase